MEPVYFISTNQAAHRQVLQALEGLDVRRSDFELTRVPGATLGEQVHGRIMQGYQSLAAPCFTQYTMLYLEGRDPISGDEFARWLAADGPEAMGEQLGGMVGRARMAVGYTDAADPDRVIVLRNEIEGSFLSSPRGDGGYRWDRFWLPDGCRRTVAEMDDDGDFVTLRTRAYLELADILRGRDSGGTFEAYVSVEALDPSAREGFESLCDRAGARARYERPPGSFGEQEDGSRPFTTSLHRGTMPEALGEARRFAETLQSQGFGVGRLKLEAIGRNADIPQSDRDAEAALGNYFQFHIKVMVGPQTRLEPLADVCERHGARLSESARKIRCDGLIERLVTLRVPDRGRESAHAQYARLLRSVRDLGLAVGQRKSEYTVYDSKNRSDGDWRVD